MLAGFSETDSVSSMFIGLRDYQLLFKVIENLCSARSPGEVQQATLEGLAGVVPGDCYDLVLFGSSMPENNAFYAKPGTYTEDEMRYMIENAGNHPLARAFLHGESRSDQYLATGLRSPMAERQVLPGVRLSTFGT